jgi:hypothetical protein
MSCRRPASTLGPPRGYDGRAIPRYSTQKPATGTYEIVQ